jgi:hypothetical protein
MACPNDICGVTVTDHADPRSSAAFKRLDHIACSFRTSFPNNLKMSSSDNVLDPHLYVANLIPHVYVAIGSFTPRYELTSNFLCNTSAIILLHDPYAAVHRYGCLSSQKILASARAILELIYHVWSTSYDITLLDSFCVVCLYTLRRTCLLLTGSGTV